MRAVLGIVLVILVLLARAAIPVASLVTVVGIAVGLFSGSWTISQFGVILFILGAAFVLVTAVIMALLEDS